MEILDHALPRHPRRRLHGLRRGRRPAAGGRGRAAPPALRRGRARRGRRRHERQRCASRSSRALEVEERQTSSTSTACSTSTTCGTSSSSPASPSCATRRGRRSRSRACRPTRASSPTCFAAMRQRRHPPPPPVRLVRRPRSSGSSSRRSTTPTCSRSSRPCTARRDDSPLVPALIRAAERGKQAVCLVEVKARFDERANIHWARALEEAGVHVVYGLPSLKTHAKCILVVRREGDGVRHYVHVGTGNYHPTTARLYTDFGLLTCDDADRRRRRRHVQLPHRLRPPARATARCSWRPTHLRDGIIDEIERDDRRPRARRAARGSRMKMNSLVDRACIQALYRASQAGVPVDLNIRGICCLRPGVPGVSENIRVVSIVGRFLEHSRIYAFERNGEHARLHRLGRPDAAQPRHPRRAAHAGATTRSCAPTCSTRSSAASPTTRTRGSSATTATWTRRTPGDGAPHRAARADARPRARAAET